MLSGAPGTGKSSVAFDIADTLGWRYYSQVITSRSKAQSLLWHFDAVAQIRDAQRTITVIQKENQKAEQDAKDLLNKDLEDQFPIEKYIEPGPLWWAHNPSDAKRRGAKHDQFLLTDSSPANHDSEYAVVLVDEIDKADPDLPNDLLEIMGSFKFTVTQSNHLVEGRHAPLVIITTNQERFLPDAFLRRCICYELPDVTLASLEKVGHSHLGGKLNKTMISEAAAKFWQLVEFADTKGVRKPSTAEFLDLLNACNNLGVRSKNDDAWPQQVVDVAWKDSDSSEQAFEHLTSDD